MHKMLLFLCKAIDKISLRIKSLPFLKSLNNKKSAGQILLEFIFLLLTILVISMAFYRISNQVLGIYWRFVVNKITYPTKVDFR